MLQCVDGRLAPRAGRQMGQLRMQVQDLPRPEPRLVAEQLGQIADPLPHDPVPEGGAQHPPGAGARPGETEKQLDGRRLARAVRPEQAHQLAAPDGEIQAVERHRPAVTLDDALELDDRF